jgi:hypothetical protein
VAIPTYERDLCKLKYTLRSLSLHDPEHRLGGVYIMWVSLKPASQYWSQLEEAISEINQTHDTQFLEFTQQVQQSGKSGWAAQQVIKLKVASQIEADNYVVLDSKNTLIRDVAGDTFLNSCNQSRVFATYVFDAVPEPHKGWYEASARCLNVPEPAPGTWWPASITPMVFQRSTVLSLLEKVGERASLEEGLCNGQLCGMLGFDGSASEFTLYLVHAMTSETERCGHDIQRLDLGHEIVTSLWRHLKTNLKEITAVTSGRKKPLLFGAQAGALDSFYGLQRQVVLRDLAQIYRTAGLMEPSAHLESPHEELEELVRCVA